MQGPAPVYQQQVQQVQSTQMQQPVYQQQRTSAHKQLYTQWHHNNQHNWCHKNNHSKWCKTNTATLCGPANPATRTWVPDTTTFSRIPTCSTLIYTLQHPQGHIAQPHLQQPIQQMQQTAQQHIAATSHVVQQPPQDQKLPQSVQ